MSATALAPSPVRTRAGVPVMLAATVGVGGANYGLSLAMAWLLAPRAYASFAAANTLLLVVGTLATASVPWVLAREVAAHPPGSPTRRGAVRFSLLASLALCAPTVLLASVLVRGYAGDSLIAAVDGSVVAILLVAPVAGYLQGSQRFPALAGLRVAEVAIKLTVSVVAAVAGAGAAGVVGGFAAGSGACAVWGLVYLRRERYWERMAIPHRTLIGQAAGIGGIQFGVAAVTSLDVLVEASLHGAFPRLAAYQAMLVVARVPLFVSTALATVLFPRLAAGRGTPAGRRGAVAESMRSFAWLSAVVVAIGWSVPSRVLELALPRAYAEQVGLLRPLVLAGVAGGAVNLLTTVHQAVGRIRTALATLAVSGVVAVAAVAAEGTDLPLVAWTMTAVLAACTLVLALDLGRARLAHASVARCLPAVLAAAVLAVLLRLVAGDPAVWVVAALAAAVACAVVSSRRRRPGPPRLLHLAFEDPWRPGAGGGSRRTHEVDRRLAAAGWDVTVVVARHPGARRRFEEGVRYLPFGWRLPAAVGRGKVDLVGYFAAVLTTLPWLVWRTDPDLVVEDFAAPVSSLAVPWLTTRPVVGQVQWLFAEAKARQYRLPFHWVERVGVASHRDLVAVSADLAAALRTRNPRARVSVIPNGLDLSEAALLAERPRPAGRWPDRTRDVVFLGRLEIAQKGLDLLLDAVAVAGSALDGEVFLAGDGPDEALLRAQARRLGLADRVHFLGRLDGPARLQLLADARCVAMPSRYETFGIVAAEALSVATPVVAFDIDCLRALVDDTVGRVVPAGDVAAFAAALVRLCTDDAAWRACVERAPARVADLDWDRVAAAHSVLYAELAGVEPPAAPAPRPGPPALRRQLDRALTGPTLLVGNYGNGNIGDDSILAGLLVAAGDTAHLCVPCEDAATVAARFGVRAVPRVSWAAVRELLRCETVLVGGGGLFGAGLPPLVRALPLVLLAARLLGRDIGFVAVGAYPDTPRTTRLLLRACARLSRSVTVRDAASRATLGRGSVVGDPATWVVPADRAEVARRLGGWALERPFVVSIKATPDRSELERVVRVLGDGLGGWSRRHPDATVAFVTMSRRADYGLGPDASDLALARRVAELAGLGERAVVTDCEGSPALARGLVAAAGQVFAMRLRVQIYATDQRVPLFAAVFEPKSRAWLAATVPGGADVTTVEVADLDASALDGWLGRPAAGGTLLAGELRAP